MTSAQIDAVLRLVRAGASSREAAMAVGCSTTTVRSIRLAHGCAAKTGRQETKPWRAFSCSVCGAERQTKRDGQTVCDTRCMLKALHAARWKLPPDEAERRALLSRLYWDEGLSTPQIARRFGMNHKGILDSMRALGIARRPVGPRRYAHCIEPDCQLPIFRIQHKGNGVWYGRRCRLHWIVFRMMVNQRYNDKHLGKDDEAWLRRLRQALTRAQRVNREVSQSLKPASRPVTTSPVACPPS